MPACTAPLCFQHKLFSIHFKWITNSCIILHRLCWMHDSLFVEIKDLSPVMSWTNLLSHGCRSLLSGPISCDIAIPSLRYPISRDSFKGRLALPQNGAIPSPFGIWFCTDLSVRHPILQRIARQLCDTPSQQARKSFSILSLYVSRDRKSIAAGPLR